MASLTKLNQSLDDIILSDRKSSAGNKKKGPAKKGAVKKRANNASKLQVTIRNDKARTPRSTAAKKKKTGSLVVSIQGSNGTLSDRFRGQKQQAAAPKIRKL